jgi:hypothetical protein
VRYYFDTRDGSEFIRDDEGLELAGSEPVRLEATRGLADWAKDAIPGATRRKLSVEVRDSFHNRVLAATLWLEVAEF